MGIQQNKFITLYYSKNYAIKGKYVEWGNGATTRVAPTMQHQNGTSKIIIVALLRQMSPCFKTNYPNHNQP